MNDISELKSLSLELESEKRILSAKKKVLKNFKISTDRSQKAVTNLTLMLFLFGRDDEIREITEFFIRHGHIDSYFLPYMYACYIYIRKNDTSDDNLITANNYLSGVDPGWPDTIEKFEKKLAEDRETGEGKYILLGLSGLIHASLLEFALGDRSSFSQSFLEEKIEECLIEARSILGAKAVK